MRNANKATPTTTAKRKRLRSRAPSPQRQQTRTSVSRVQSQQPRFRISLSAPAAGSTRAFVGSGRDGRTKLASPVNPDPTNHHQSLAPRLVVFVEVGDADVWCGGLAVHLHRGESWTTVSAGLGQPALCGAHPNVCRYTAGRIAPSLVQQDAEHND